MSPGDFLKLFLNQIVKNSYYKSIQTCGAVIENIINSKSDLSLLHKHVSISIDMAFIVYQFLILFQNSVQSIYGFLQIQMQIP